MTSSWESVARGAWREKLAWAKANREDSAEVIRSVVRDDTGITYETLVSLRSLAAHAREEGEDRLLFWDTCVTFGQTDATHAGGAAFKLASLEQERRADEVAAQVWGAP